MSICALWPTVQPASCKLCRKAARRACPSGSSAARFMSTPTRRIRSPCCARAAIGHAAAPPSSVINSRRLIVAPRGSNHARHRLTAVRVLEWGEGDVSCDQLFWAGNVGSGSHDRRQNPKSSVSADAFPVCPRQQTYLPISELLPPPAFRERGHRGLACLRVAVHRRAIFVVSEGERPHPRRTTGAACNLQNAPSHRAVGEHVVIVIVPLAG